MRVGAWRIAPLIVIGMVETGVANEGRPTAGSAIEARKATAPLETEAGEPRRKLVATCGPSRAQSAKILLTPRVRPVDRPMAMVLLEGLSRSPTLRAQVDALQSRDVVVYLARHPTLDDRIGAVQWVGSGSGARFLKAWVNAALPRAAMIAAIGHELEHALEVGDAPSVVDAPSLTAWFAQSGLAVRGGQQEAWDTQQAYDAGERIRRELSDSPRPYTAPMHLRQPIDWWAIYQCRLAD